MIGYYYIAGISFIIIGEIFGLIDQLQPFVCELLKTPDVCVLIEDKLEEINPPIDYMEQRVFWSRMEDGRTCFGIFNDENNSIAATAIISEWRRIELFINGGLVTNNYYITAMTETLFSNLCLFHNGIVLHSAAIELNGIGIVFSAPSGTGKSTHADLWVKHLGATYINGDRPLLRIVDGKVQACGTAWSGSAGIYRNVCVPLSAIVFLEQHTENKIRKLVSSEAIKYMLPRCFLPYHDMSMMEIAIDNIEAILARTNCWHLKCLPDVSAMEMVRDAL